MYLEHLNAPGLESRVRASLVSLYVLTYVYALARRHDLKLQQQFTVEFRCFWSCDFVHFEFLRGIA